MLRILRRLIWNVFCARTKIFVALCLMLVYFMYNVDRSGKFRLESAPEPCKCPVIPGTVGRLGGSDNKSTTVASSQVHNVSVKPLNGDCFSKNTETRLGMHVRPRGRIVKWVEPVLPDSFWTLCEPRPYRFRYLSNPVEFCTSNTNSSVSTVIVLMLVPSAPDNHEQRNRIRQSWGKRVDYQKGKYSFASVFLIGRIRPSQAMPPEEMLKLQASIDAESIAHRDIIQGDFLDSYRNLTYKMLMGLDWATTHCPQAQYVFRTDDDVDVDRRGRLVDHFESSSTDTSAVMCMYEINIAKVMRDPRSKWHVTYAEYPEDTYPGNCPGGPGYVLSMSAAKRLLEESYRTRWFWVDDVYITGMLRAKLGLPLTHVYYNKTRHEGPVVMWETKRYRVGQVLTQHD